MLQENCQVLIKANWDDEERPCDQRVDCSVKVGDLAIAVCDRHFTILRRILSRGYRVPVPLRLIERAED